MNEQPTESTKSLAGPAFLAFFLSCSILALEISLTRVFSVVLWYHFGFMIISLAMLGFALAGAALHARLRRRGLKDPRRILVRAGAATLLGAGVTVPLVIGLTRIPVDPIYIMDSPREALLFASMILLTAVPFFLLGYGQCAALEAGRDRIARVYGASFMGGAVGVAAALGGMQWLGGGGGIILAALAAWIGGSGIMGKKNKGIFLVFLTLVAVVVPVALFQGVLPDTSRKHFPQVAPDQVLQRKWNAFSSVVFYKNPERHGLWAIPPTYQGPLPDMLGIAIDEWAITSITKWDGDASKLIYFEAYPPTLGLETAPDDFTALVIGAGGGLDVLGALYFGARHVTAVELNPLIVEAVENEYSEYSGGIYHDPRVEAYAAEGRHFVEREKRTFDRIIITGVDTYAASTAGAFALSENYIHTVEAFQAYYRRLGPEGMLCMTRWFFDPPRQTLRLVAAAREALIREGIPDPDRCFFLARAQMRSLILIKKTPFTGEEIQRLSRECDDRGAMVIYADGFSVHPVIADFFTEEGRRAMEADYPYRVDAPTDDCPFLFEHRRWKNLFYAEGEWFLDRLGGQEVLFITFLAILFCLALGIGAISLARGKDRQPEPDRPFSVRFAAAAVFFLIGTGYMMAEVVLLPRMVLSLGHPVFAMSIVLMALLIFSGFGSLLSRALAPKGSRVILITLLTAVLILLFFHTLLGVFEDKMLHGDLSTKILISLLLLVVPGIFMGMPFPLAIRYFTEKDRMIVPKAFLWNGAASALACPVAYALAISWGFYHTLLVAIGTYLAAAVLVGLNLFLGKGSSE